MVRVGRSLYTKKYSSTPKEGTVWSHKGRLLYNHSNKLTRPTVKIIKDLLKDDTFFVEGADFNTLFTIGDKVIVSNWKTPLEILNVKTLMGFKYDESTANISFILMDKNEKLVEEMYVHGETGTIYTGRIRKVTNKFEKLTAGTKITAKVGGNANFPMKDVNIVIAILIDGPHEPLVLCSNGCTLWYSTIMKDFKRTTMRSKTWKTLKHVPLDLSKIKFQAGDIVSSKNDYKNNHGYVLHSPSQTKSLRAGALQYYPGHLESYMFDKYFMSDALFDCIPNPRLGPKKQADLGVIKGYYDFHGGVVCEHVKSPLLLINESGETDV